MVFKKLNVKAKSKNGRGSLDAAAIEDAVKESWDDLSEAIRNLDDDEQERLKNHFNSLAEDENDLGDILFGDQADFEARLVNLDDAVKKQYFEALVSEEVLDRTSLEAK